MITKEKPENFNSSMCVGGIIFRVGDEILLFKRAAHKRFGAGQWTICAGKIEENETCEEGIIRECFEETGLEISKGELRKIDTYYHSPESDSSFQMEWVTFEVKRDSKPAIVVNDEHDDYTWVHIKDVFGYDLIDGEAYSLEDYLKLCR